MSILAKRCLSLFLTISFLLQGCAASQEKITLNWKLFKIPGMELEMEQDAGFWQSRINEELEKLNKNYQVEIELLENTDPQTYGMVDIAEKISELSGQNDPADLIGSAIFSEIGTDLNQNVLHTLVQNNLLAPVELDDPEASKLKEALTKADLEQGSLNGQLYTITTQLAEVPAYVYSKEFLDKYQIDPNTIQPNLADNLDWLEMVQAQEEKPVVFLDTTTTSFGKTYTGFGDIPALIYTNEGFASVLDSSEWMETLENMLLIREKGILETAEEQTIPSIPSNPILFFTDFFGENYRTDPYWTTLNINGADQEFYVVPNPDVWRKYIGLDPSILAVTSWSDAPDEAMDFLMELATNPNLSNIIQYGSESDVYLINDSNQAIYQGNNWRNDSVMSRFKTLFSNSYISASTEFQPADKLDTAIQLQEQSPLELPNGFVFDYIPVLDEVRAVNEVFWGWLPVEMGGNPYANEIFSLQTKDLDQTVENLKKDLDDAGLQTIIDEANRQLEEWKESEGKGNG